MVPRPQQGLVDGMQQAAKAKGPAILHSLPYATMLQNCNTLCKVDEVTAQLLPNCTCTVHTAPSNETLPIIVVSMRLAPRAQRQAREPGAPRGGRRVWGCQCFRRRAGARRASGAPPGCVRQGPAGAARGPTPAPPRRARSRAWVALASAARERTHSKAAVLYAAACLCRKTAAARGVWGGARGPWRAAVGWGALQPDAGQCGGRGGASIGKAAHARAGAIRYNRGWCTACDTKRHAKLLQGERAARRRPPVGGLAGSQPTSRAGAPGRAATGGPARGPGVVGAPWMRARFDGSSIALPWRPHGARMRACAPLICALAPAPRRPKCPQSARRRR